MNKNLIKLGRVAWVVGVIFAGLCLFLVGTLFAFSQPDWESFEVMLVILAGGTYITGLLIAKKWPLTGGGLSLIMPVGVLIFMLFSIKGIDVAPETAHQFRKSALMFLIYMLPGLLHLLYWWLKRKYEKE
ncbi:MAG: hypothetical protein DWQ02_00615 [Bacteroidetes bacterium]|nr:MAG: hypothetical protein DWQ02_00615 [Bacteroidota bacterium]